MAKTGRPSSYSDETADEICRRIAEGQGLREIGRAEGMPSKTTVMRWLADETREGWARFRDRYAQARMEQADHYAEEILEIADDATNDWMERRQGEETVEVVNHEHIQRSRLRVDSRKWLMSKLAPKKYGEKLEVGGTGSGGAIQVQIIKLGDVE